MFEVQQLRLAWDRSEPLGLVFGFPRVFPFGGFRAEAVIQFELAADPNWRVL